MSNYYKLSLSNNDNVIVNPKVAWAWSVNCSIHLIFSKVNGPKNRHEKSEKVSVSRFFNKNI